jgi:hypothetical protein
MLALFSLAEAVGEIQCDFKGIRAKPGWLEQGFIIHKDFP